jgi:putative membrane protein insertion efficiency factor
MSYRRFFVAPIRAYQYVSRMLPAACRYYPTCSEYAKWQFMFNAPHRALAASTVRILSCNQLFPGGIDYPVVHWSPPRCPAPCRPSVRDIASVRFWLIPYDRTRFSVVKAFRLD